MNDYHFCKSNFDWIKFIEFVPSFQNVKKVNQGNVIICLNFNWIKLIELEASYFEWLLNDFCKSNFDWIKFIEFVPSFQNVKKVNQVNVIICLQS